MALKILPKPAGDGTLALVGRLLRDTGRRHLPGYGVAILFSIVIAATMAGTAWVMRDVINGLFIDRRGDLLFVLPGIIVALAAVRGLALYGSAVALGRIGNSIVAHTQKRLFDHLLTLDVDFYRRFPSSDLITRIAHNANAARDVLNTVIVAFGRDLLTVIGLVAVMVIQAPALALAALVIGPLAVVGLNRLLSRIRGFARAQVTSVTGVIATMQETAHGIRSVKSFNLEPVMRGRMNAAIEGVRAGADQMVRASARSAPVMEILGGVAIAAVLLYAGYRAVYFGEKPGAFTALVTALLLAWEPARRLARTGIQVEAGMVGVRLMYELLDTRPALDTNPGGPRLVVAGGGVAFAGVDFAYRKEAPLFRGLDFRAEAGKVTALVGPSGGGKSTIMALIERFYDVDGGRVAIDGQDIAGVEIGSLRDQMALVSQEIVLFRESIRQNIRFGRPDASDAEIEAAAKGAMAHDFILALPSGYDTVLGTDGVQLSGGQRQRIAIARAMLRRAPIILLDEATSSLDSESEYQVQVAFDRLMEGRTTIVIAHRLSTVLHADKICVLVDGAIVEEGRHERLVAAGGVYARLHRLQFEKGAERNPAA